LFRFVSCNQKLNISVCFGVSSLYRNNRNKQNCFETNRNKPKRFSTEHLQLQPGLHSCWQTRPGASQSSCRQTRTGAAKILADRHVQVQHKAPVGRHIQVQRKALVDRHLYVEHKALVDRHARCSTKVLENTKKTRPGAAHAAVGHTPLDTALAAVEQIRALEAQACSCRPHTSGDSTDYCTVEQTHRHVQGKHRLL
jgi:hypothetical protein